ncbi:MAG TPA: SIR2 family protein [Solirubrobacterales bacterium]|nr:SIR2 family protein [Solirubrobacterales bacterium]
MGADVKGTERNAKAEQLMRAAGFAVPVLGAGVSVSAGLPGSAALADFLLESFGATEAYGTQTRTLRGVVDALLEGGAEEEDLLARVAGHVGAQVSRGSPLLDALVRVPSRFLLTLDFDLAAEAAARSAGRPVTRLGNGPDDLERAHAILVRDEAPTELTVLHLHGHVDDPASLVLGERGYRRIDSDLVRNILYELVVRQTLVFYGTTLDENYLLAAIERTPNRGSHVLWCREEDRAGLVSGRGAILPSRTDVYIGTVAYHEDLPATVALLSGVERPESPPLMVPAVEPPGSPYVTNRLLDRHRRPEPQEPALLARLRSGEGPDVGPSEDDVLDAQRTVVLGDPGSGKSELLRSLAARSPGSRPGVFVRLGDLTGDQPPEPRAALAAWASQGQTTRAGIDVGPAALEEGRLHFFLDGLDEVPSARQAELADLINLVARELPQHSFTVSTRELPSLELLRIDSPVARDWSQVLLAPDGGWRDRYLAARGVALDRLQSEMPALEDMDEVLVTPFYLRHIVDLHEDGELGDQRDAGDLLATLIDRAITREQGELGAEPDDVRRWLAGVALAGVLAGRRTLSGRELALFPPPASSGGGGPGLARALEDRLLLSATGGGYRFHHRLLGEQLAAEALVAAGPRVELLDCLAPLFDKGLSGVRPDAVMPVGLACLRSPDWRAALARRDPAAAARATSRDAPPGEREAALASLWRRATDKQVWIWERGSGLTDDAVAMSRLMRGLPDGETAALIKAAVDAGTRQDQGNAIRIWSRLGGEDLRERLRAVLGDPGRDGVVLRQAAIGAAEAGFTDLIDDIVDMLLGQSDKVIHQDGIIALRRLMGAEPDGAALERLVSGPEADYAMIVFLGELSPPAAVRLMAAYLAADNEFERFWAKEKIAATLAALRPEELEGELLEDAVDVAVRFGLEGDVLAGLAAADPPAVARRLAELIETHGLGWWHVHGLAIQLEPGELAAAGIPSQLVERVAQGRRLVAERDELLASGQAPQPPPPPEDEGPGPGEPLMLGSLLEDDDTDVTILNAQQHLAAQIDDLGPAQLRELRRRLQDWWPGKPFRETITREGPNRWSQEAGAAAWVWFGPAARPDLSPAQWGQLATSGVLYSTQAEWLREVSVHQGLYEAIASIGDDGDPDRWCQLFECAGDPLPGALLDACARHIDSSAAASTATVESRLRQVAERMVGSGRRDLARRLGARDPLFATVLDPVLASHGDGEAQGRLFTEVISGLEAGGLPSARTFGWISAVGEAHLLPRLFDILRLTFKTSDGPLPRAAGNHDLIDLTSPTIEAIARIGGREALSGYDGLIDEHEDFRWLGEQRARIAASILAAEGARFAPAAAARIELPPLAPDELAGSEARPEG